MLLLSVGTRPPLQGFCERAWGPTGGPCAGAACTGALAQGCACRRKSLAGHGQPRGQAACSPRCGTVPCCQDGCQGHGFRMAWMAALGGLGEPWPVLCTYCGVVPPHHCLPPRR